MANDQHLLQSDEPAADRLRAAARTQSAAGSEATADGGDPACWACLVCQECGAVVSEGHRAGCSQSS